MLIAIHLKILLCYVKLCESDQKMCLTFWGGVAISYKSRQRAHFTRARTLIALVILSHGMVWMLFVTDSVPHSQSKPVIVLMLLGTSSTLVHVIVLHLSGNIRTERTFHHKL